MLFAPSYFKPDKVAGGFIDREARDNWGMAGVSRADSKKAVEDSKRGYLPVPFSFYFLIPIWSTELT